MLSLASNPNCLLMDDELNVLPTSSHVKGIAPVPLGEDGRPDVPGSGAEAAAELKDLRESLADTQVRTPCRVHMVHPGCALSFQVRDFYGAILSHNICRTDCWRTHGRPSCTCGSWGLQTFSGGRQRACIHRCLPLPQGQLQATSGLPIHDS